MSRHHLRLALEDYVKESIRPTREPAYFWFGIGIGLVAALFPADFKPVVIGGQELASSGTLVGIMFTVAVVSLSMGIRQLILVGKARKTPIKTAEAAIKEIVEAFEEHPFPPKGVTSSVPDATDSQTQPAFE